MARRFFRTPLGRRLIPLLRSWNRLRLFGLAPARKRLR